MHVAHLCDAVPHGLVNSSKSQLSPMQVRNGNSKRQCGGSRGKHLETITENDQPIWPIRRKDLRKPENPQAHRLGSSFRSVGGDKHLDAMAHRIPRPLNICDSHTELRSKVHAGNEEAHIDFWMGDRTFQQRLVNSKVRTPYSHDGQSHRSISPFSISPAATLRTRQRPSNSPIAEGRMPVPGRMATRSHIPRQAPAAKSRLK